MGRKTNLLLKVLSNSTLLLTGKSGNLIHYVIYTKLSRSRRQSSIAILVVRLIGYRNRCRSVISLFLACMEIWTNASVISSCVNSVLDHRVFLSQLTFLHVVLMCNRFHSLLILTFLLTVRIISTVLVGQDVSVVRVSLSTS